MQLDIGSSQTRDGRITAPSPEFAVEAFGIARRFSGHPVLSGVSISVRKGEFFSLLGPSGCGKTTLLRIIAGLDLPDEGQLKIGGRDASEIPAHQRPVHTVFQSYALFPHLKVWDNVAFGLRMKKTPAAELSARVERVLDLVRISSLRDRRPAQLSGGEKQRAALARAVVNEPDVLLLDEPLGALDLKLRKQLQIELRQLQRRLGITFIYVTHDQDEAIVMSDRIAVMNAGRIEQVDAPRALYERPRTEFVARFLGQCNLLTGRVVSSDAGGLMVSTVSGVFRVRSNTTAGVPATGTEVMLAFRPENFRLAPANAPEAAATFSGVIVEAAYGGAKTHYRLDVGGCQVLAVALNARAGTRDFQAGERVRCQVDEESVILLESP